MNALHSKIANCFNLYALQNQYGGSVFESKKVANKKTWTLYKESARHLVEEMLCFLIEKKKQAELILAMDDNGWDVKTALRALKGNWTVKRAADCEFSENDNADDVIILE